MSIELIETIDLPAYSVCYLINGDSSGLEDSDIERIDMWLEGYEFDRFTFNIIDDEPSFTYYPEFGLACECFECELWGHPNQPAEVSHGQN